MKAASGEKNFVPDLRPGLSILVPAYNEEALLEQALRQMLQAAQEAVGADFELVVVNDGSQDRTGEILERLASEEAHIRVLHHDINRGIGAGITTAGRAARYNQAIICPVDNPLPAELLRAFWEKSASDVIVVGYRPQRLGYRRWQHFASRFYHALACFLLGLRLRDINWIHLYPTSLFYNIDIQFQGIVYLAEVLAKAQRLGYRFVEIEAPMRARPAGVATISKPRVIWRTFWDLWRLWAQMRRYAHSVEKIKQ